MTLRVLILGAGGHGQVVADIVWRMRDADKHVEPIGFLDDDTQLHGQCLLGVPVLGSVADLALVAHDAVVVAVGDCTTRKRLFLLMHSLGKRLLTARHPSTVIAPDVQIGPGSMICAGVVVNTGSIVGANVILNTGCTVDHHNQIHDHVHIAPGVHLGGGVIIGEGSLIGIGATILPGMQVGASSVVGAGAVVTQPVRAHSTVAGVPARPIARDSVNPVDQRSFRKYQGESNL